ncbi:MAG TPA: DUF5612 domain-containing protein [Bryobacteraceae bacterium]|jgi:energy-converting hydrogenase B subunit Q
MQTIGIVVRADSGPGILHQLTGVIAQLQGDIGLVEIIEQKPPETRVYFEIDLPDDADKLQAALGKLAIVRDVQVVNTMQTIYGKRIIIVGGGAQVGQVAIGAISEADRHNIRGEHISVDTIPLVGEKQLAEAVRACARLPRAKAVVLAGSIMGGDIENAVREIRAQGLLVVSLNMAGSVPAAADLVVTDPVQAGVMTVMAVADTAKFTVDRLKRREF